MNCTVFITVDAKGKNAKLTKSYTRVQPWEICFPLIINIPDTYFKRPVLSAAVNFDDFEPLVTDVDVAGISDAIREATGVSLKIEIENPPEA